MLALLHEHPTWSKDLIADFEARGVDLLVQDINHLDWEATCRFLDFRCVVNRVNAMPSEAASPAVVAQTLHYLHWLELGGVRVINGAKTHFIGCSKAAQMGLFSSLGLCAPRSLAVHQLTEVLAAAKGIGYPVIVKPNIGGSGSGISLFQDEDELALALKTKQVDLGVDGTGVVQEYIRSDGYVYRVEILGDGLFYAIRQAVVAGNFNYCAAEGCSADAGEEEGIQVFQPSADIVAQCVAIIKKAGADVGGVEYMLDEKTGLAVFYDFNPYSNFVSSDVLGFSPEDRFVDFVTDLAGDV